MTQEDRKWARKFIAENWKTPIIVTKGKMHHADSVEGFVARIGDKPVGLVTFNVESGECEILTLDSITQGRGIGTRLVEAVKRAALTAGCRRVWLITSNDNTPALRFYQKRGFRIVAVYPNALEQSRKLKPEISLIGIDGIPLRDEIELEVSL